MQVFMSRSHSWNWFPVTEFPNHIHNITVFVKGTGTVKTGGLKDIGKEIHTGIRIGPEIHPNRLLTICIRRIIIFNPGNDFVITALCRSPFVQVNVLLVQRLNIVANLTDFNFLINTFLHYEELDDSFLRIASGIVYSGPDLH